MKEKKRKEKKRKEKKRKEKKTKEKKRKGKERKGKERKGKERKGKERKGKERKEKKEKNGRGRETSNCPSPLPRLLNVLLKAQRYILHILPSRLCYIISFQDIRTKDCRWQRKEEHQGSTNVMVSSL
jgi:hypothetical protein